MIGLGGSIREEYPSISCDCETSKGYSMIKKQEAALLFCSLFVSFAIK
ncbi:hypothetical protein HMPREF9446_01794 [Bacteroides fluxus YIT 12057]|uniref:Uncharacterized protein n=1 Tax=Bacteroides fluxus YIT 12057 TaxID=763034 RepID=F3PST2_9BACE|nr:hypothetical protein HMPREF9446_01794 [Bacteroides fluxus YIT 12057]